MLITAALSAVAALNLIGEREPFVTWEGIGPDKWGTVWLIRRYVDPTAPIELLPAKTSIGKGVAFDVPEASLKRKATTTAFEKIIEAYVVSNPGVTRMAAILNEIEIYAWQVRSFTEAARVESAFRTLQMRHGREHVPFPCYLEFFDNLYAPLANSDVDLASVDPERLSPREDCGFGREIPSAGEVLVPELSARAILARMARGDNVVFVDAREDAEYAEGHIPGAINLKLREVGRAVAKSLSKADLVVPYCVKDFRGFEVARALQKAGVRRVAIMNPYGIRGWRQIGLPVAGMMALSVTDAIRELDTCLSDVNACLSAL